MASVDVEIRKLDFQSISDLSDILDYNEDWKRLMAIVPADLGIENCKQPKYTGEHFGLLEYARKEQNRSCTAILIEEWGTSGKIRPRLSTLRDLLVKAELFRAADYVSKLLNEPSPERPENGPAAPVSIPDVDQLPIVPAVPVPSGGTCPASNELFPTVRADNELVSFENRTTQLCLNPTPIDALTDKVTLPYKVLCDATDNFNENLHLGSGSCGTVYLGTLQPGDRKIAVKRLHREGVPGEASEQFKNEIKTLSQLGHPNLLTLLGFSSDGEYLCLVYPFMGNGSLSDILENQEKKGILNWKLRLDIALGLANGIAYLHEKSIIHRDIKTANVLLDDSLEPKLGDFGLVRPRKPASGAVSATIFTQTVVGTSPYMSLEAFNGVVTDKMDVFSFGVVLLELLTGLPAFIEDTGPLVDYIFEKKSDSDSSSECFMQELIDVTAGNWSSNVVNMFSKLALECLASEKSNRPNMVTIIERLQNIIGTK